MRIKKSVQLVLTVILALVLVLNCSAKTMAASWVLDGTGWRYRKDDGSFARESWILDEDKWYYLGTDTYMLSGTFGPDGRYIDETGALVRNSRIDKDYMKRLSAEDAAVAYNIYSHTLELWSCGQLLYSCRGNSGRAPGDKEIEGDGKTPLGEFYIVSKNEQSKLYKSLGLSYPNAEDAERGLRDGLITKSQYRKILNANKNKKMPNWYTKLGGAIMIHGEMNASDGSSGCVAINNEDIDFIWHYVKVGTPVIIMNTQ